MPETVESLIRQAIQTLTVPAAEYVPAIPEAWAILERALLAHLEGGEQKWLPIETAPRDNEPVILGFQDFSAEGFWMDEAERNHWRETGWFFSDDDVLTGHPTHPTHWMPLPAAPGTSPAEGMAEVSYEIPLMTLCPACGYMDTDRTLLEKAARRRDAI